MKDARKGYNYGSMQATYARYQITVSDVPFPAPARLLLGGLAGLGVVRKRKTKSQLSSYCKWRGPLGAVPKFLDQVQRLKAFCRVVGYFENDYSTAMRVVT